MADEERSPHSSDLRKYRGSSEGTAYLITKCATKGAEGSLTRPECALALISGILFARDQGWCTILGFVIMPDHYHLIIGLTSGSLSRIMESINKYSARRINEILGRSGSFWQDGYYEHAIRDRPDFDDMLDYVHGNPVKAEFVEAPGDWEYSTANEKYAAEINWEWIGPSFKFYT